MEPWTVTKFRDSTAENGPQRQTLWPGTCCGAPLSDGWVMMPPGHMAAAHLHAQHHISVKVVYGWVASLLWQDEGSVHIEQHGPGDTIRISPGVGHIGCNLSRADRVVLIESRTDPFFNRDVTLLPHMDEHVQSFGRRLQRAWQRPPGPASVLDLLPCAA
jgi:uncharacterized RmlC-like cupin family protein